MKRIKRIALVGLMLTALLFALACSSGGSTGVVVISAQGELQLLVGYPQYGTKLFTIDTGGLSGTIVWRTSNPSVASINQNGLVTAVRSGTAQISANLLDDEDEIIAESNTVSISVAEHSITIAQGDLTLYTNSTLPTAYQGKGNIASLSGTVSPGWGWMTDGIEWTSSLTSVATVNISTGLVEAVAPGTTVITAKSAFGNRPEKTITIKVEAFSNANGNAMLVRNLRIPGAGASPETPKLFEVNNPTTLPAFLTNNGGGDRYTGISGAANPGRQPGTPSGEGIGRATISYLMEPLPSSQPFTWTVVLDLEGAELGYTSGQRNGVAVGVFVDPFNPMDPMYQPGGDPGQIPELTKDELPFIGVMRNGTASTWQFTDNDDGSFRDSVLFGVNGIGLGDPAARAEIAVSWNGNAYSIRITNLVNNQSAVISGLGQGSSIGRVLNDKLFTGTAFHPGIMVIGQSDAVVNKATIISATLEKSMPVKWVETVTIAQQVTQQSPTLFTLDASEGTPSTMTLTAGFTPADAYQAAITWTSSHPAIASVDPVTGVITAVSGGSPDQIVEITAKAAGISSAPYELFVIPTVVVADTVTITKMDGAVVPGTITLDHVTKPRAQFEAEVSVASGIITYPDIIWESSDETVLRVDRNTGLATAMKAGGTSTITAKALYGTAASTPLSITVTPYVVPTTIPMRIVNSATAPGPLTTESQTAFITLLQDNTDTNKFFLAGNPDGTNPAAIVIKNGENGSTNPTNAAAFSGVTWLLTEAPIPGKFRFTATVNYNRNDGGGNNKGMGLVVLVEPPTVFPVSVAGTVDGGGMRFIGTHMMEGGGFRTSVIGANTMWDRASLGGSNNWFPAANPAVAPMGNYVITHTITWDGSNYTFGVNRPEFTIDTTTYTAISYTSTALDPLTSGHLDTFNQGKFRYPALYLIGSSAGADLVLTDITLELLD